MLDVMTLLQLDVVSFEADVHSMVAIWQSGDSLVGLLLHGLHYNEVLCHRKRPASSGDPSQRACLFIY